MTLTNAQKQAALRQRRKEAGLVLVRVWVTPEVAEMVRGLLSDGVLDDPVAPRDDVGDSEK